MIIMKRYFTIWIRSTTAYLQVNFASRLGVVLFTTGKLLRFSFFLIFLFLVLGRTNTLAGYSLWEIVFFFATFNLIDIIPQMFLRSVYSFKSQVVSGNFDFYLAQPVSPLFRALFSAADMIDLPMLLISIGFIFYSGTHLSNFTVEGIFLYVLLVLNALLIAFSFHIFVLSVGVATTEVDNTIMLYRDLTQMGRVPITIYQEGVSFLLTFVIPVGIMMTFPVEALMGSLSVQFLIISFTIGVIFLLLSLLAWRQGVKNYSSASS